MSSDSWLVIFDCDGVLVDSEPIANRVLVEMLAEVGLPMTLEASKEAFMGRSMKSCYEIIEGLLNAALPADFANEFDRRSFAALAVRPIPMPGVECALDTLAEHQVGTCVASSGSHDKMGVTLGGANLLGRFRGRIYSAASDVSRGKPHPDIFLHAAKTLGHAPERCVVVEDSPLGVEAARRASMCALGFARDMPAARLAAAGAEVFYEMHELPDRVLELCGVVAAPESNPPTGGDPS